ncbi:hypothetical protein ACP70R_030363 [Stipagrostis hirtigluma subsp. patula]
MSSDSDDWRPLVSRRAAATDRHRRTARREWSYDPDPVRGRSPSPSPVRRNGCATDDEQDRRGRSRSRSRSRGRSRRRAPRSCRSRSRTRSEECEDTTCCRPRGAAGGDQDADQGFMWAEEEDDWTAARIGRRNLLFNCTQCNDLLSSPVHECENGHVTCGGCHDATANGEEGGGECSRCGSTEYSRSRAVAGFLRSIRFPCENYTYGCPALRPRQEIDAHERDCRYAPCFCPVRRCDFHGGPPDALERHLTARHGWGVVAVRYGQPFHVHVHAAPSLLRAEDGALFHLCAEWERGGTAMSMICIRPDKAAAAEEEFTYEVKTPEAAGLRHRLQMQSTVWGTSLRYGRAHANPVKVTVPDDMFPREGPEADAVEVRVHKVAPAGDGNN